MARGRSHAFRKGFLLGGIAAGAAMLWNAPQAGARTREQILETIEGALFKALDFPASRSHGAPAPAIAAAPKGDAAPADPRPAGIPG
jgi:hypothetical protein